MMLLGENIKRLRRERNLTQEEMAGHLGISFQSISKWERGEGYPDITMLPALAHYFSTSIDELLGMSNRESFGNAFNARFIRDMFSLCKPLLLFSSHLSLMSLYLSTLSRSPIPSNSSILVEK